jgi:hypothetical protein
VVSGKPSIRDHRVPRCRWLAWKRRRDASSRVTARSAAVGAKTRLEDYVLVITSQRINCRSGSAFNSSSSFLVVASSIGCMHGRTHGQSNNSGDYAQSSMSRDNFFPMCFYTKPAGFSGKRV